MDKKTDINNDKTSKKYGCEPNNRTIDELLNSGMIVVDKDSGPTSRQTATYLKKVLKIDKVGHSGTLDPKVTGVLVCGLGRATRLMEYMLKSNKEYICLMYVHKAISDKELKDVLKKFTGKIMQLPPIVSAIKRQLREREVYYLDLLDANKDNQEVLFRIGCQHGTYIRKICSDIGDELGVKAHMQELRRTKAGPFKEDTSSLISLDNLRNLLELYNEAKDKSTNKDKYELELRKHILPMEDSLVDFKKVYVRDNAINSICHGSDLAIPGVSKLDDGIEMGEEIAMLSLKGELIGMGLAFLSSKDVVKKKKGAFIKTNKVLMDIDVYPKLWDFKKKKVIKKK